MPDRKIQIFRTREKNESRSEDGSERDRIHAAPKGNAKTLRQKDRSRTTLRKVRYPAAHQRGNRRPPSTADKGTLSGMDGGRKTIQGLSAFFVFRKSFRDYLKTKTAEPFGASKRLLPEKLKTAFQRRLIVTRGGPRPLVLPRCSIASPFCGFCSLHRQKDHTGSFCLFCFL